MKIRGKKEIIRDVYKKYVIHEDNLIHGEKFFFINSLVNYIYEGTDEKERMQLFMLYGDLINQYLNNLVDMHWKDGKIVVEEWDG